MTSQSTNTGVNPNENQNPQTNPETGGDNQPQTNPDSTQTNDAPETVEEFQAHWEWTDAEGVLHTEPFLFPDYEGELEEYVRKYIAPEYEQDFPAADNAEWVNSFFHDVNAKGFVPSFQLQKAPEPRLNRLFFPTCASQYAHIVALFDDDEIKVGQRVTLKTNVTIIKDASFFLGLKDVKELDLFVVTKRNLTGLVPESWKETSGLSLCVLVDWRYFMRGAAFKLEEFEQVPGYIKETKPKEEWNEHKRTVIAKGATSVASFPWIDENKDKVPCPSGPTMYRLFWGLFKSQLFSERDFNNAVTNSVLFEELTAEKETEIGEKKGVETHKRGSLFKSGISNQGYSTGTYRVYRKRHNDLTDTVTTNTATAFPRTTTGALQYSEAHVATTDIVDNYADEDSQQYYAVRSLSYLDGLLKSPNIVGENFEEIATYQGIVPKDADNANQPDIPTDGVATDRNTSKADKNRFFEGSSLLLCLDYALTLCGQRLYSGDGTLVDVNSEASRRYPVVVAFPLEFPNKDAYNGDSFTHALAAANDILSLEAQYSVDDWREYLVLPNGEEDFPQSAIENAQKQYAQRYATYLFNVPLAYELGLGGNSPTPIYSLAQYENSEEDDDLHPEQTLTEEEWNDKKRTDSSYINFYSLRTTEPPASRKIDEAASWSGIILFDTWDDIVWVTEEHTQDGNHFFYKRPHYTVSSQRYMEEQMAYRLSDIVKDMQYVYNVCRYGELNVIERPVTHEEEDEETEGADENENEENENGNSEEEPEFETVRIAIPTMPAIPMSIGLVKTDGVWVANETLESYMKTIAHTFSDFITAINLTSNAFENAAIEFEAASSMTSEISGTILRGGLVSESGDYSWSYQNTEGETVETVNFYDLNTYSTVIPFNKTQLYGKIKERTVDDLPWRFWAPKYWVPVDIEGIEPYDANGAYGRLLNSLGQGEELISVEYPSYGEDRLKEQSWIIEKEESDGVTFPKGDKTNVETSRSIVIYSSSAIKYTTSTRSFDEVKIIPKYEYEARKTARTLALAIETVLAKPERYSLWFNSIKNNKVTYRTSDSETREQTLSLAIANPWFLGGKLEDIIETKEKNEGETRTSITNTTYSSNYVDYTKKMNQIFSFDALSPLKMVSGSEYETKIAELRSKRGELLKVRLNLATEEARGLVLSHLRHNTSLDQGEAGIAHRRSYFASHGVDDSDLYVVYSPFTDHQVGSREAERLRAEVNPDNLLNPVECEKLLYYYVSMTELTEIVERRIYELYPDLSPEALLDAAMDPTVHYTVVPFDIVGEGSVTVELHNDTARRDYNAYGDKEGDVRNYYTIFAPIVEIKEGSDRFLTVTKDPIKKGSSGGSTLVYDPTLGGSYTLSVNITIDSTRI